MIIVVHFAVVAIVEEDVKIVARGFVKVVAKRLVRKGVLITVGMNAEMVVRMGAQEAASILAPTGVLCSASIRVIQVVRGLAQRRVINHVKEVISAIRHFSNRAEILWSGIRARQRQ